MPVAASFRRSAAQLQYNFTLLQPANVTVRLPLYAAGVTGVSGAADWKLVPCFGYLALELTLKNTAAGEITEGELSAAKQAIISGLRSVPDAPGALENFYGTASIAGMRYDLPAYIEAISAVTAQDVARCAASLKLHTVFFLKGEAK